MENHNTVRTKLTGKKLRAQAGREEEEEEGGLRKNKLSYLYLFYEVKRRVAWHGEGGRGEEKEEGRRDGGREGTCAIKLLILDAPQLILRRGRWSAD